MKGLDLEGKFLPVSDLSALGTSSSPSPPEKERPRRSSNQLAFGNGMWETASILSLASFCVPYNAYVIAFLFIKALELHCWTQAYHPAGHEIREPWGL